MTLGLREWEFSYKHSESLRTAPGRTSLGLPSMQISSPRLPCSHPPPRPHHIIPLAFTFESHEGSRITGGVHHLWTARSSFCMTNMRKKQVWNDLWLIISNAGQKINCVNRNTRRKEKKSNKLLSSNVWFKFWVSSPKSSALDIVIILHIYFSMFLLSL